MRTPFQGVFNIIRFNRQFYLLSLAFLLLLWLLANRSNAPLQGYLYLLFFSIAGITLISLLVSWYVYDLSGLYHFSWLTVEKKKQRIVNINAGFDETSVLLSKRFPDAELIVLDFYHPLQHTEVSIKRARKAYPPFPGTQQVLTASLPVADHTTDKVFVILSAHEIRNPQERTAFFRELNRITRPAGEIFIVEHLRDPANFLAYNIGFFHFYSKTSWQKTFSEAQLNIKREHKLTPFISTFILEKNGSAF